MASGEDLRTYYAAERTLLSWVRTGSAVIGLGFVVARFGLFLRIAAAQTPGVIVPHTGSNLLGVGLVLLGGFGTLIAVVRHARYVARLHELESPDAISRYWPTVFATGIGLVGLTLAVYLLLRAG